jgi:hypothetical protein
VEGAVRTGQDSELPEAAGDIEGFGGRDRLGRHHRGQREPVADGLAEDDDVGDDA